MSYFVDYEYLKKQITKDMIICLKHVRIVYEIVATNHKILLLKDNIKQLKVML